jgi:hypothetical protein
MHKNTTKGNKTLSKWCKNRHGASKIIDTVETYQSTTCKEAMMGPDFVKWLEVIKSVIVPYTRNQVSELGRPSIGMKPNERIWIYKQIWMFLHL